MGDLRTPFGATDAVHVRVQGDDYGVEHVGEGDSVAEVLSYVQYSKDDLMSRVRRAVETALRDRRLTPAESGRLMRRDGGALEGYTDPTLKTERAPVRFPRDQRGRPRPGARNRAEKPQIAGGV